MQENNQEAQETALFQKEKQAFLIAILSITSTTLVEQGYTGEEQTKKLTYTLHQVLLGLIEFDKSPLDFFAVSLYCVRAKLALEALMGKQLPPQFTNAGIGISQTNDETPKYGRVCDGETVI